MDTIKDYITGENFPDIGSEQNRQAVERILVDQKGYDRQDILVNWAVDLPTADGAYRARIDLIVRVDGRMFMVIKCAAGSLGSRERETLAAARIIDAVQVPYTVVTDGKTVTVLDTITGGRIGTGMEAIPSRSEAEEIMASLQALPFPKEKRERETLIFRSYDMMTVNVANF